MTERLTAKIIGMRKKNHLLVPVLLPVLCMIYGAAAIGNGARAACGKIAQQLRKLPGHMTNFIGKEKATFRESRYGMPARIGALSLSLCMMFAMMPTLAIAADTGAGGVTQ